MNIIKILLFSFLLMLTSCFEATNLVLHNKTKEDVEVSIISEDIIVLEDTIWDETKKYFYARKFVGIPNHFSARNCLNDDSLLTEKMKLYVPEFEGPCYSAFDTLDHSFKLTFTMKPNQRFEMGFSYNSLESTNMERIDTMYFKMQDGLEIHLNGTDAIMRMIKNKRLCSRCIITITDPSQ